ncbi:nucleolar protein 11-like [Danio rerio]|uniref:Nucleolar protein 11-like n=1 Tax=Danio rerio TaxID=7955 RepID=NOL11_DANRE|nr:nucleolar protein 11-like [Danio rerio]Q4V9P9.1 RecName: Full=Nucleolar protein 11-like [Danio rerio]AAH96784.1 Zgc:109901 [Danio rerio]|eukprot:NP_001025234.1 nucleolar protein 11-like [Danio rerio]
MATLYEEYTLCGVGPDKNSSSSGILGIELGKDVDHIIVTNSSRAVTVYKVSDQKPTGSWTVKQGQLITCPAVYNTKSQEYVVVTDNKVIRVWKEDDVNMEKAFKATVSSDVLRVIAASDSEPVVLFSCGAVMFLDSLLASPQQTIEGVLTEEEFIRWSTVVGAEHQLVLLFCTEKRGEHYLYAQRFNPNTVVKHRFETEPGPFAPISFSATCRGSNIHLQYLYMSGRIYESVLPLRSSVSEAEGVQALPRSLCLSLPLGEQELTSGAAIVLDEAHVAIVGFPHPSAGAGKDYLCIWNKHFQTLQACKELAGTIYSQIWCYSGKLYIPHGKILSVISFECQKSSLAAAMGKLKQTNQSESKSHTPLSSWTALPHNDSINAAKVKSRMSTRNASNVKSPLTVDQLIDHIKTAVVEDVQSAVGEFIHQTPQTDLQLAAGKVTMVLVSRSQTDDSFYPQRAFLQLLDTRYLCYSVCPELLSLAMAKRDFQLCQIAFQLFPDIPEAVTCAYLKTILSTPDSEMETLTLDTESLIIMKEMSPAQSQMEEGEQQNENGVSSSKQQRDFLSMDMKCPVGLHKGVLLNDVLQTAYSDKPLLQHLKDLTVLQVMVFLQYLHFLYLKYSQDVHKQIRALRIPSISQVIDWASLILDAHFTVLAVAPEAKSLVSDLHKFTRSQVKLYAELGKIEGSLQSLKKPKSTEHTGVYSIEVIELF